jgi:hypothetical protein
MKLVKEKTPRRNGGTRNIILRDFRASPEKIGTGCGKKSNNFFYKQSC